MWLAERISHFNHDTATLPSADGQRMISELSDISGRRLVGNENGIPSSDRIPIPGSLRLPMWNTRLPRAMLLLLLVFFVAVCDGVVNVIAATADVAVAAFVVVFGVVGVLLQLLLLLLLLLFLLLLLLLLVFLLALL